MSYCRWSTPNCDLYCYESDRGYETHVAGYRERKWKEFYHWLTDKRVKIRTPNGNSIYRYPRWGYLFFLPHWLTHTKIGLRHDGANFIDDSLIDFYDTVKMLEETGYLIPDYLLPEIHAEMIQEIESQKTID